MDWDRQGLIGRDQIKEGKEGIDYSGCCVFGLPVISGYVFLMNDVADLQYIA